MPGIAVIANPNSRQNRKDPSLIERLRGRLGDQGTLFATTSLADLADAARQIRAMSPDLLCFNGGDGTNSCSLSAVMKVWGDAPLPTLSFLRGGTMNTVAGGLGISGAPEEILLAILDARDKGQPLPVVEVATMAVGGERWGFLFGTGMQAKFLEIYYEGGDASPWKAVKVLTGVVGSAFTGGGMAKRLSSPTTMQVRLDGELQPRDAWDMVGAGTVPNIAFFFRPYFRSSEDKTRFHVWGVSCGVASLSLRLPRIALAMPPQHEGITERMVSRLDLTGDEILYQLDGEIHRAQGSLTVTSGPTLRVVRL